MFRWIRWHFAKERLTEIGGPPPHIRLSAYCHKARLAHLPPDRASYERLAVLWDNYASWFVPDYSRFLADAADIYGLRIDAALDLACGTGLVTRDIAAHVPNVVGLDISEAMLREAHARSSGQKIRYVRADFRDFELGQTFQAVVCSSDSLNYLERPEGLVDVLRCVARHLDDGGYFVFDALGQDYFYLLNGIVQIVEVGDERFEMYSFYDTVSRVEESRVVFEDVIERHRRIPLEPGDVRKAASEAGLKLTDQFSRRVALSAALPFVRSFYVLRKRPSV